METKSAFESLTAKYPDFEPDETPLLAEPDFDYESGATLTDTAGELKDNLASTVKTVGRELGRIRW